MNELYNIYVIIFSDPKCEYSQIYVIYSIDFNVTKASLKVEKLK